MKEGSTVSVLFVCMGNICRSPTAEGVFRHTVKQRNLLDRFHIDSAGTHAYHIGEQPDSRSQKTARSRGIDLSTQTARKAINEDFNNFDYIIAMDRSNYENLKDIRATVNSSRTATLHLFMEFASSWDHVEVPDPYYGGDNGFEQVFDMVQSASEGLLAHIVKHDL